MGSGKPEVIRADRTMWGVESLASGASPVGQLRILGFRVLGFRLSGFRV